MGRREISNRERRICLRKAKIYFHRLGTDDINVIVLNERGVNDPHVLISIYTEDDGQWLKSRTGSFSSFWLPDLQKQLKLTQDYLEKYCEKDGEYGYKFKENK